MAEIEKICCVVGDNSLEFPWNYKNKHCKKYKNYLINMFNKAESLVKKENYTHFILGCTVGVDMDFAEAVIFLRDKVCNHIKLEIVLACVRKDIKWSCEEEFRYNSILENADKVTILSEHYNSFSIKTSNKYIVDKANLVLAFWNLKENGKTYNTIYYARDKNKLLEIIDLNEFCL